MSGFVVVRVSLVHHSLQISVGWLMSSAMGGLPEQCVGF